MKENGTHKLNRREYYLLNNFYFYLFESSSQNIVKCNFVSFIKYECDVDELLFEVMY